MQTVTMETLKETKIDVFKKFSEQMALVTAGTIDHFNTMTVGWGMMGNVWGHTPGVTVYISPNRYTWEFMEQYDYFTITFFDEKYCDDLMMLGSVSGRDEDKVAKAGLQHIIQFEKEDCMQLSYPSESFDAVTAAFGIRNFSNLEQGLSEMCRVLRKGGHLCIADVFLFFAPAITGTSTHRTRACTLAVTITRT